MKKTPWFPGAMMVFSTGLELMCSFLEKWAEGELEMGRVESHRGR